MPVRQREPDLRIVEGISGTVDVHLELTIRFDYSSIVPWVTSQEGVWRAIGGPDAVSLWTPIRTYGKGQSTVADFPVHAGERIPDARPGRMGLGRSMHVSRTVA